MYYKIGIDVGGTNTDAVLVNQNNKIIAKVKKETTLDVSTGIQNAIQYILRKTKIPKESVKYIMLGTTHCTNALVERKELNAIGALRICLPASSAVSMMCDFPEDLKQLLGGRLYMVHGGYEFDGDPISTLDKEEVVACLLKMKGHIDSLAITGVFSKICPDQELQVAAWAQEILGEQVKISCSYQIGGLGLLERENATILNASLQGVATKMVKAFKETVACLGLNAQLFIGQNDGTLMSLKQAQDFPVLTISSGPTNSIRGAGALSKVANGIVIDVGGTTSDGGVLVQFFPRESTKPSQIGGVLTNFRMPDVVSVGIGGGTFVRFVNGVCTLGPDSVGYRLKKQALAFGGDTLTLSDFFIAEGQLVIGNALDQTTLKEKIDQITPVSYADALQHVKLILQSEIEKLVDKLKTEAVDIPVIACGGGAFLLPKNILGASEVLFLEHMEVANAFGACIAQISSTEEIVIHTSSQNEQSGMDTLQAKTTQYLIDQGAVPESIQVLIKESSPLAYLPGALKLKVKVCGDLL